MEWSMGFKGYIFITIEEQCIKKAWSKTYIHPVIISFYHFTWFICMFLFLFT